ncbi:MAG TPA: tyrosine-type recombinase/integrase [Ferruginibacter sp.]|nr:tyrosine-type recombinase/integrase [Ferruginibacter sp.]
MTILKQAIQQVPGFAEFAQRIHRRMRTRDLSISAESNYSRSLACLALHFKKVPTLLTKEQVEEYLYLQLEKVPDTELTTFRFTIHALRFAYHMEGLDQLRLNLPVLRTKRKLPVVLSKEEVTAMINRPKQLRHRVLIALLYGCGLRCSEVKKLKVADVDLSRKMLHVRQAKGRKDRMIPIGEALHKILNIFLANRLSGEWLFRGYRHLEDSRFYLDIETGYGQRSIQWAIKRAAALAGIRKNVTTHSLRHTYATHLLESGVNIFTIQYLMGHARFDTTMVYLHVAEFNRNFKKSPMDDLNGVDVFGPQQGKLHTGW